MARPKKNTAEYFSHDCHHGKTIPIIKHEFGNDGYAFWFQLLELLGKTSGHVIDTGNPDEWGFLLSETLADEGFGVRILDRLAVLKAIDRELWDEGFIWCQNFVERLDDLYKKRKQEIPQKPSLCHRKHPLKLVMDTGNPVTSVVSGAETHHIILKQSKVNKININNPNSDSDESVTKEIANVDPDKELKIKIEQSFKAVSGEFASYPKERQNIKRIISCARLDCPDDVENYIRAMLEKFKELTEGNDKFYSKLEFSPSKLIGCWMNVRKLLKGDFDKRLSREDEELLERMCGK